MVKRKFDEFGNLLADFLGVKEQFGGPYLQNSDSGPDNMQRSRSLEHFNCLFISLWYDYEFSILTKVIALILQL